MGDQLYSFFLWWSHACYKWVLVRICGQRIEYGSNRSTREVLQNHFVFSRQIMLSQLKLFLVSSEAFPMSFFRLRLAYLYFLCLRGWLYLTTLFTSSRTPQSVAMLIIIIFLLLCVLFLVDYSLPRTEAIRWFFDRHLSFCTSLLRILSWKFNLSFFVSSFCWSTQQLDWREEEFQIPWNLITQSMDSFHLRHLRLLLTSEIKLFLQALNSLPF